MAINKITDCWNVTPIVWQTFTKKEVSYTQDGASWFFRKVGKFLPNYMVFTTQKIMMFKVNHPLHSFSGGIDPLILNIDIR